MERRVRPTRSPTRGGGGGGAGGGGGGNTTGNGTTGNGSTTTSHAFAMATGLAFPVLLMSVMKAVQ